MYIIYIYIFFFQSIASQFINNNLKKDLVAIFFFLKN